MKKTLSLILLSLVMTACSTEPIIEPPETNNEIIEDFEEIEEVDDNQEDQQDEENNAIVSVKNKGNQVIVTHTNGKETPIDYTSDLDLEVSLGDIMAVNLSPSKKFISIETNQAGGTGVIIHQISTAKNYVVQSHTGSLTWEGDRIVLDNEGNFEDFTVKKSVSEETPWELEVVSHNASTAAIYDSCGKITDSKYSDIKDQLTESEFAYFEHNQWLHSGKYIEELCYSEKGANLLILLREAEGLGNNNVSVINYDLTDDSFTSSNDYNILYGTTEFGKRTGNIVPIEITGSYPDFSDNNNPTNVETSETIYYNLDTQVLAPKQ